MRTLLQGSDLPGYLDRKTLLSTALGIVFGFSSGIPVGRIVSFYSAMLKQKWSLRTPLCISRLAWPRN